MKLFADDSSIFTRVLDVNETQNNLVNHLKNIEKWAHQWKMLFNPDLSKQAIEIVFSAKKKKGNHPQLVFNSIPVARVDSTKHLGLILDEKLSFAPHIRNQITKAMKGISILKFLSRFVSRDILIMCYKMYVRPHLDYGDVIFHNSRLYLMALLEQVQYKASLVITGCWQGTSRSKLYDELGLETLSDRRWFRRLSYFYKITNYLTLSPSHSHVPHSRNIQYNLRTRREFQNMSKRTARYSNSFYPHCITEWEKLGDEIKSSPNLASFKQKLLSCIRPIPNSSYSIEDIKGIKLITMLRVEFSDLRSHRYHHNFNCDSPLCRCLSDEESNSHFLLRCPLFANHRQTLLGSTSRFIGTDISILPMDHLTSILLYGSNAFNSEINKSIISETISYIKNTKRFDTFEAFL